MTTKRTGKNEEVEVEAERHRLLRVKREIYAKIAARLRRQEMSRQQGTERAEEFCITSRSRAGEAIATDYE